MCSNDMTYDYDMKSIAEIGLARLFVPAMEYVKNMFRIGHAPFLARYRLPMNSAIWFLLRD